MFHALPTVTSGLASRPSGSRKPFANVSCAAAPVDADLDKSGLKYLSAEARERALAKKSNKFEKVKAEKCGSTMWTEVTELAALIREGKSNWEDLNLDDIDVRMKWSGLFHRRKRQPGTFMMRLKVPNGELTSEQLRELGDCITPFGDAGCADITTRANIQLRGITLETADQIMEKLDKVGLTSKMSGMDNVRNLTGNPIAGLDPHEVVDTRPILAEMQDMITDHGKGRADLTNLPRKINICISPTRDDFPHTHINDIGFEALKDPSSGEVVYNLVVGGYFSTARNVASIPSNISVTGEQLIPFTEALLKVFRDHGARGNRQKTRLMWLVEEIGLEKFKELCEEYMGGGVKLNDAVEVTHDDVWERRDLLGVHEQKQEGLNWVGCCIPAGRIQTDEFYEAARLAETYGDGTVRITCEENILFVNVPKANVDGLLSEPLLEKWKVNPGNLQRGLVSCTGSQFCGFALIETKQRAVHVADLLEKELDIPKPVRIHWTGCPNSCGQAQVGDIGIMGGPAKLNKKAVEGVKLFLGGKIGEGAELASEFEKGIPAAEEYLVPKLKEMLIENFGATPKQQS